MSKKGKIATCIVTVLVLAIIFLIIGFMISLLWNNVIPAIFGLPAITCYQGIELSLLIYALSLPINLSFSNIKSKQGGKG